MKINRHHLSIVDSLIELYKWPNDSYKEYIKKPDRAGKSSVFYYYIEDKFEKFINVVNSINIDELKGFVKDLDDFKGVKTRQRFVSFIKRLCKEYMNILRCCYVSNQTQAFKSLEKLLGIGNPKIMRYLMDIPISYTRIVVANEDIFFRARDCSITENPDNCWHTPFNLRQKSYSGRFSLPGFPCLYLANDQDTCCEELGKLPADKARWVGKFSLKKHKRPLAFIDLTFPKEEKIKEMNNYELFCLFVSYPLHILCCTPSLNKEDGFAEEYLFSQLLINLLSNPTTEKSGLTSIIGVAYNSTKNAEGINYALPAIPKCIPPLLNEQYSDRLIRYFEHSKPIKITR